MNEEELERIRMEICSIYQIPKRLLFGTDSVDSNSVIAKASEDCLDELNNIRSESSEES